MIYVTVAESSSKHYDILLFTHEPVLRQLYSYQYGMPMADLLFHYHKKPILPTATVHSLGLSSNSIIHMLRL